MSREKMVCIEWEDAAYSAGYYNKKEPERFEPVFTRTVGHLVKIQKKSIIVGMDRFYEDGKITDDRHLGTIPKKMIRRIIYLEGKDNGI